MAGDIALGAYMGGGGNFGMGSGPGFSMDTLSQSFTDPYGFRSFGQNLGSGFGNMGSSFNPSSFGGTSFNPIIDRYAGTPFANNMGFIHPITYEKISFEAERPKDFDLLIKSLRKASI